MITKVVLFILTLLTLTIAGATFEIGGNVSDVWQAPELLGPGLLYASMVLSVLVTRELAYALAGRLHGARWTPPYVVPAPNLFGALGAIHTLKEVPSKKALFDMSAAAVVTGFVHSVILVAVGLHLSETLDSPQVSSPSLSFNQPLLFQGLLELVKRDAVEAGAAWHPLAFAGWTGLLITAIAALPVGQLDGGHMLYALLGTRAVLVTSAVLAVLTGVGLAQSAPLWIILVLIMLLIGHRHPTMGGDDKLGPGRVAVAVFMLAILALCFTVQPTGGFSRHG